MHIDIFYKSYFQLKINYVFFFIFKFDRKIFVIKFWTFILQVETGWDRYIHVRIYRDLHGNASVSSVQLNKSADDVIGYF